MMMRYYPYRATRRLRWSASLLPAFRHDGASAISYFRQRYITIAQAFFRRWRPPFFFSLHFDDILRSRRIQRDMLARQPVSHYRQTVYGTLPRRRRQICAECAPWFFYASPQHLRYRIAMVMAIELRHARQVLALSPCADAT